jgi:hypothetical protein
MDGTSNDSGVGVVNFPTSENLTLKNAMLPYRNIQTYTWACPEGERSQPDYTW